MAMEKKYLIVNTGSDSHKYALYSGNTRIFKLHLEKDDGSFLANIIEGDKEMEQIKISELEYLAPVEYLLQTILNRQIILNRDEISLVGFRIVAPGEYFITHKEINDEYLRNIVKEKEEAPLHIGPILNEIEQVQSLLAGTKLIGISDSEFHRDLPEIAIRYSLPKEDSVTYGVRRFGYHGISISSVIYKIKEFLGKIPQRIIVCHLGSGSSITAIKDGKSFDTSMGFTPLEGLPMGGRVGNIDPGALMYLGSKMNLTYSELEIYLNTKCGLLGLSGKTKDVRELIELEKNGDLDSKFALDSFAYNLKKYIGAYTAAMGGIDLLVFTATIGERSSIMRTRFCSGLEILGIILDKNKNEQFINKNGFIDDGSQPCRIAVIPTDEMAQIAREIQSYL